MSNSPNISASKFDPEVSDVLSERLLGQRSNLHDGKKWRSARLELWTMVTTVRSTHPTASI